MTNPSNTPTALSPRTHRILFGVVIAICLALGVSCVTKKPMKAEAHRWWSGLGPVLPHDTFPADCSLCHVGTKWNKLRDDFEFDHKARTGVALEGAHETAQCLRCHNDRGRVAVFARKGCVGCHEDFHSGQLGAGCTTCHTQETWRPYGQVEKHNRTRFPLTGAHANTACWRCHPGARVGKFVPTDTQCLTCHRADLARTDNPPHIPLGWVDRCDRCHTPTRWEQGTLPD